MRGDLLPTVSTGVLLLMLGLAFLGVGAIAFAGSPMAMSLWVVLLGLLVLASGIAAGLLERRAAAPDPSPAVPTPAPASAAPARSDDPPTLPSRAPMRAPARAVDRLAAPRAVERAAAVGRAPTTSRGVSTSIPGAYLQSVATGLDLPAAPADSPPIAAALPFSAGLPRPSGSGPAGPGSPAAEPEAVLELELARLRARVRELETPRQSPVAPATPAARSGAATSLPGGPGGEPPAPPSRPAIGARGCVGCGLGLPTGRAPLLCWGCGRGLCATCFWRYGPGPGLHRCPDCLSKAVGGTGLPTSISGGRAGPAVTPSAPLGRSPPPGPAPPPGGR